MTRTPSVSHDELYAIVMDQVDNNPAITAGAIHQRFCRLGFCEDVINEMYRKAKTSLSLSHTELVPLEDEMISPYDPLEYVMALEEDEIYEKQREYLSSESL